MKTFYLTLQHIVTKEKYTQPVLAKTLDEAKQKALDWPYNTNGDYIIIKNYMDI